MISHTNNHDITFFITRKWKLTSRFIVESRSSSFSINEKLDRSNFATLDFSHEFFTHLSFISISKFALIFNKKFVESKFMYQTTEIETEKLKNRNVAFNRFSRQCCHCKQFFIFKNLFHKHLLRCNKSINKFKHARMIRKLNDF